MEDIAFDRLTRSLGAAPSRRAALQALATSALAGLLTVLVRAEVQADFPSTCKTDSACGSGAECVGFKKGKRRKGKRRKDKPGKCRCLTGLTSCPGTLGCVDLQSSNTNCGTCGNTCRFDLTCMAGRCQTGRGCQQGATLCNNVVQCGPIVSGSIQCACMTSVETGRTACSDITVTGSACSACTTDAECTLQLGGTPGICSPGGPNCVSGGLNCTGATPNLCTAFGCLGTTSVRENVKR